MIKGNTVIFNEEYIDELTRLKEIIEDKYEMEISLPEREELKRQLDSANRKLDYALNFQDTIQEIINIDMPNMRLVKTITGKVIPVKIIKII